MLTERQIQAAMRAVTSETVLNDGAEGRGSGSLLRTWKSRAGDAGIDRFTRDLIQQHAQTDTGSKHYDRYDYLPQMREAMNKWEIWLRNALA